MVGQAYVVPSYQAPEDTSWYHFLHGNVPGHQIDFMYRPEVPQGQLSRQHFSHLSRLMKYIEPQTNAPFAFAIGNLSRDDTQYVPGHGGVALIFGLRIRGTTDHAGRQDPPFAHAIAAVDRDLDYTTLFAAATAFHRHVLVAAEAAEWYRSYVRCATESPVDVEHVLAGYVESFRGLPQMPWSSMSLKWVTGGATQSKRIVIVHENGVPFDSLAHCAARIAAMLYRSDIRWTSISSGREADLPNGVSIRLIAERDFAPTDATENVLRLRDVPENEAELAAQLFGAKAAEAAAKPALVGWRERYEGDAPGKFDPAAAEAGNVGEEEVSVDLATLPAELVPVAASAPVVEAPARLPPVMSSGAGAMQPVAPPLAVAPFPPAALPPRVVPRKADTDWKPTPEVRKTSLPRVLWVILALVVGGAGAAGWVLLSAQGTPTAPVTLREAPPAPVPSTDNSALPAAPAPSSVTSVSAVPSAQPPPETAKTGPAEESKPTKPGKTPATGKPPIRKPGRGSDIGGPPLF